MSSRIVASHEAVGMDCGLEPLADGFKKLQEVAMV